MKNRNYQPWNKNQIIGQKKPLQIPHFGEFEYGLSLKSGHEI